MKLDAKQRAEIVALYRRGVAIPFLVERFRVSRTVIHRVLQLAKAR